MTDVLPTVSRREYVAVVGLSATSNLTSLKLSVRQDSLAHWGPPSVALSPRLDTIVTHVAELSDRVRFRT